MLSHQDLGVIQKLLRSETFGCLQRKSRCRICDAMVDHSVSKVLWHKMVLYASNSSFIPHVTTLW